MLSKDAGSHRLKYQGTAHGEMDSSTEKGYSAAWVAEKVLEAVQSGQHEVPLFTHLPQLSSFTLMPSLLISHVCHNQQIGVNTHQGSFIPQVVLAPLHHRLAILLRAILPSFYFYLMARRAKAVS